MLLVVRALLVLKFGVVCTLGNPVLEEEELIVGL